MSKDETGMSKDETSRALRDCLGCYATGVTVVTTMTPKGPLGMTANSFASVSLDPPLVLWSPARKSARFPAFEAASHFAVHVLAEDQQPMSSAFAASGLEPFSGLDYETGLGDVPLLNGCAARFECVQSAGHDGGDHLILVGEVKKFEGSTRRPLLYHRGDYAQLVPDQDR